MRRDRVGMQFKIKDITEQWLVSRPTVMKRIKDGKLIGEKDGSTGFGPLNQTMWLGALENHPS